WASRLPPCTPGWTAPSPARASRRARCGSGRRSARVWPCWRRPRPSWGWRVSKTCVCRYSRGYGSCSKGDDGSRTLWLRPDIVRFRICGMRRYPSRYVSSFSFGPGPVSTALKVLIGANVVMFVVTTFVQSLIPYLGLIPAFVVHDLWLWQVATYMFLYGGIFHILFNMLALWMFGAELERTCGAKNFLNFFFVTAL